MARIAPARASVPAAADVVARLRADFDTLTPELKRAATWVADHPNEMIAPLALVELLVAWLRAKGGRAVPKRLASQRAYWDYSQRNSAHGTSA